MPDVSFSEDGTLYVNWGCVLLSLDADGFEYAVKVGQRYRAGRHEKWPEAVKEIQAAISAASS